MDLDLDATNEPSPIPRAPERPLPPVVFYSVEYPGYVKPTSVQLAVSNLGGQDKLDQVFKRTTQRADALVEVSLRPGNPFAHPIPGDVVNANNLLLKVVKRKRKAPSGAPPSDGAAGEYTAKLVGVLSKTVRFRSMADYQYFPDMNDPVSKLRLAMDEMDANFLGSYQIPHEPSEATPSPAPQTVDNDIDMNLDPELLGMSESAKDGAGPSRSTLRLFPPPLFSRQTIPQNYNFKANSASMISTTIDEETGEERKRIINKMRWKGYGPASIMFDDPRVPDKPPQAVEEGRGQIDQALLKKLESLFQQRPVWTRMSLFNQCSTAENREILNSKLLLPLCCYVFQDGPWRDTLVRFSYDPRKDPDSRFYQRLYFRNANHPISRPSVTTRRHDRYGELRLDRDAERKTSHIFDGTTLTKETAAFQLCDIVDPMLKSMIERPDALRETCHERDGWFLSHAFEQIKTVLRHKFFSLLEGHPATDEECRALLVASEGAAAKASLAHRSSKLRAGRHNMAKGAMSQEEAAALRLRATLDRNMKSFQSQR
ncbi:unnamed protein product [Cyclocybe aegerita]|uniref:RNA polymerase III transcription factor IIIC subunit-domain-containing protein n=1 Tax=Cyclocybe aegerita TaxID=1973307 RepID=A0A8S0VX45_CYCAE|nr:unnamed protein product [Cyclocybe aegerita]